MSLPSTPSSPRQEAAPNPPVLAPVHADLHPTPVLSNAEQTGASSPSPSHAQSPPASPRRVKGKRRLKTSPRDREILEDAFRRNPRPNRHDRLEILKELSDAWYEKRVQVWFQNRRQQERRTKQPVVLVREMEPCYGGQVRVVTADSAPMDNPALHATQQPPSGSPSDRPSSQSCTEFDNTFDSTPDTSLASIAWEAGAAAPESNADPGQPISRSFAGPVGYCANRLNPARSCSASSAPPQHSGYASVGSEPSPSSSLSSASAPIPKLTSSSSFRLSMSLDGKAEVVPSTSSPPRPVAAPPSPDTLPPPVPIDFQGRHSEARPTLPPFEALAASLPPSPSILTGPLPPRLTRGRSRDVGAWHYVCDPANREDPLTMQAKHESSGSAVAEISLIRSTSSVSSATNSSQQQQSASAKRNSGRAPSRLDATKRPRLSRSASSMPRIETTTTTLGPSQRHNYLGGGARPCVGGMEKSKPGSTTYVSFAAVGTDSDKENWDPDERFGPRPGGGHRRPLPSGPSAAGSKHNTNSHHNHNNRRRTFDPARSSPFLSGRANTAPAAKAHPDQHRSRGRHYHQHRAGSPPLEIFEDAENVGTSSGGPASDEVARFMSGDVSPSKKGDVDAVAGLLSLSQGNWR